MTDGKFGFMVTWSRSDKAFVATCFEFPGLSASGATADDAVREAQVALELFVEDYEASGEPLPEPGAAFVFPGDPEARSFAELIKPSQLIEIRRLARELDINTEEECLALLKCKVEDLSQRAASVFISYLRNKKISLSQAA